MVCRPNCACHLRAGCLFAKKPTRRRYLKSSRNMPFDASIMLVTWDNILLKLTFMQYPAIHTNYIISHCTTLQYNHNNMTRYLGRNEILNTNNNEFNSANIFPVLA